MPPNKSLNATCNLDGYLFYRMPAEALEVEIKVKTKWGNFIWMFLILFVIM